MKTKSTKAKTKQAGRDAGKTSAIEVSHPPEDSDRVLSLLRRFEGYGHDVTPGEAATSLASKALFLANIASGHTSAQVDGMVCGLGMDFVVEGGMASADFVASVIEPAFSIQVRWERNLLHDTAPKAPGQKKDTSMPEIKMNLDAADNYLLPIPRLKRLFSPHQMAYARQIGSNDAGAPGSNKGQPKLMLFDVVTSPLIKERRTTLLREATEFPFFLVKQSGLASLRKRAARAHQGHLMFHARVESPACLEKLGRSLTEIGEGSLSGKSEVSPTVRVNQVLCANPDVLEQVIATARKQPRKVSGLLWLVEASPGIELHGEIAASKPPCFLDICGMEIMRRINFEDKFDHMLEALDGRMAGWRKFLREQDKHLPGIISTAWDLPAALCYGLESMLKHESKVDGAEVIALAKWLVLRMCNRFAAAAPVSHTEGTQRLAEKLAGKLLEHGPMSVRDLTRRCSKLKKDDCQRALELLSEEGVAACEGSAWGIVCDADALWERIG